MRTPDPRPTRRPYRSPAREEAAQLTRERIIAAAEELFVEAGYVATSVRSIARAAGVAEKTVYLQFDTKAAILKSCLRSAIGGSEGAERMARTPWFLEVLAHPRREGKIDLLVAATCALHERTGLVFTVAREAAAVDADVRAVWKAGKRGQLSDMTAVAESFAEHRLIPPPREVGWLVDLLYVLLGPESWYLMRHELGHDEEHYRDWLRDTLAHALGPSRRPRERPRPSSVAGPGAGRGDEAAGPP